VPWRAPDFVHFFLRRRASRPQLKRDPLGGGTMRGPFAAPFGLGLLCVVTVACPAPGKGPKAARGYAQAQPIINALAAYHRAHDAYPDQLSTLVPDYLDSVAVRAPVEYSKLASDDYEVSFRYVGPGSNHCTYRASARVWSCSGLF